MLNSQQIQLLYNFKNHCLSLSFALFGGTVISEEKCGMGLGYEHSMNTSAHLMLTIILGNSVAFFIQKVSYNIQQDCADNMPKGTKEAELGFTSRFFLTYWPYSCICHPLPFYSLLRPSHSLNALPFPSSQSLCSLCVDSPFPQSVPFTLLPILSGPAQMPPPPFSPLTVCRVELFLCSA